MSNVRDRLGRLSRLVAPILAGAGAVLATALPAAARDQTFFAANGGSASCVLSADSPTPGPVPRLTVADDSSYAGVQYDCPNCTGSAPAAPPSFSFRSSAVSGTAGGAPSLVFVFDDFSFVQLRPRTWSGAWQFVDGAGDNWDTDGGTCGYLSGQSYETVLSCHEGDDVIATFLFTAAGSVTAPYTHFVDDVTIGGTTFTSCLIEPSFEEMRQTRRATDMEIASDVGATGHLALNFAGRAGAAGDTWIALYDTTPGDATRTTFVGSVGLSADVLVGSFNNRKGAGLVALHDPANGQGLALTVYDAGNSDTLVLSRIDSRGKLIPLRTVSLGAGIAENAWYRVTMDVAISDASVCLAEPPAECLGVTGKVFRHEIPSSPDSAVGDQVGRTLTFSGALGISPLEGLGSSGEVGVHAAAVSAVVNSSVTNFVIDGRRTEEIIFD